MFRTRINECLAFQFIISEFLQTSLHDATPCLFIPLDTKAMLNYYASHIDNDLLQAAIRKFDLERLKKLLPKIALQFKEDENLLFFLIRHQDQWDQVYGENATAKLLKKLHPHYSTYIEEKYAERGYGHLTPIIRECLL